MESHNPVRKVSATSSGIYLATSTQWTDLSLFLVPINQIGKLSGHEGNNTVRLRAETGNPDYHRGLGRVPTPTTL